ncbi:MULTISPECIES: nuclear transport factor 2 family protein [unclassified Pedobacter]|uniref:nuclear transport factor 2 family protein n=1 Tax=unclassified Pedobacter TaxID=2628915 RepID=UPI001E5731F6|nr:MULTISPECIES: nuclear transport factor 2 family protein [unclassified Pedobacter]
MKKLLPFLFLSFCALTVNAQEKNSSQKAAEQTIVDFFDALSALDFEKMKYYTKDVEFVEYGEIWNLDVLVGRLKPMVGKGIKRTNTLKFTKTVVEDNTAWVIYFNTADLEIKDRKDQVKWLESVVLVKDEGRWKISLLHSTVLSNKK